MSNLLHSLALAFLASLSFFPTIAFAQQRASDSPALPLQVVPNWLWLGEAADNPKIALRRQFDVPGPVKQAWLVATAHNHCEVFINNKRVTACDDWGQLATADISTSLTPGQNVIAISARNDPAPGSRFCFRDVDIREGGAHHPRHVRRSPLSSRRARHQRQGRSENQSEARQPPQPGVRK